MACAVAANEIAAISLAIVTWLVPWLRDCLHQPPHRDMACAVVARLLPSASPS